MFGLRKPSHKGALTELDPKEVDRLVSSHHAILVDVREPTEYAAERIQDALLFPLSSFDPAALPFDGDKQVILQCGSGKRSAEAARRAIAAGVVSQTAHLRGGIAAWKAAGLPVINVNPATGRLHKPHAR